MTRFEKSILKDLYESVAGLYAFTFYTRYKVAPDEISLFITKYTKKGVINYEGDKLTLTAEGRNIILKQLFSIKASGGKFSTIPSEFKIQKIEINSPYLPNINNVSAEILKKKEEGGIETSIKEV